MKRVPRSPFRRLAPGNALERSASSAAWGGRGRKPGLAVPTSGTATIGSVPYHQLPDPVRQVGVALDSNTFHPGRSAAQHLLVFDEPLNGLDPDGIRWLRGLLRTLAAQNRTVFLSSHLLTEVAQTVDDVIVLARGRLVTQTTLADLVATSSRR